MILFQADFIYVFGEIEMKDLKQNPSLADFQAHIKGVCKERGWDNNSHFVILSGIMEEKTELSEAIDDYYASFFDASKNVQKEKESLAGEFSDVFNYLLDVANYFDVDMEKAFRDKFDIKEYPSLYDFQRRAMVICGKQHCDKLDLVLMDRFMNGVGSLTKAMRHYLGVWEQSGKESKKGEKELLEKIFADVFLYFLDLANHFDIDMEHAYRAKFAINEKRVWGKGPDE